MTEDNYRPISPDLSSPFPSNPNPNPIPPPHASSSPLTHRASYDESPFFNTYQRPGSSSGLSRVPQQYVPPFQAGFDDMARRSSRLQHDDAPAPLPEAQLYTEAPPVMAVAPPMEMDEPPHAPPAAPIEVKTKFPVARIKRIMQADEDVGKVAQVTPIAVSKALELFMISLVTKAAQEAKDRNSKRVTASHLKHAVAKDEVLDFLADIIAKVPDQPAGRKHEDGEGSDQNEGRRKRGPRKPKEESD
ncbi:transcriptional regulator family: Histone-like TF [Penicillium waksmanii]|uniref:transcriptional regulator family: Histone-like TF n=1 Tax=Penicillium waksmanii TaxID=69791 RepID=UPI002546BD4C|nr:transcriptional regulator family: Histone-like TF [Penicillium waksmanii]KAJ5988131.1 transcriptional regulator family: Histone-like TF [Penicillium waksmanii]